MGEQVMKSFVVYRDADFDTVEIKEFEKDTLAVEYSSRDDLESSAGEVVLCMSKSLDALLKSYGEYKPRKSGQRSVIQKADHVSYLWPK